MLKYLRAQKAFVELVRSRGNLSLSEVTTLKTTVPTFIWNNLETCEEMLRDLISGGIKAQDLEHVKVCAGHQMSALRQDKDKPKAVIIMPELVVVPQKSAGPESPSVPRPKKEPVKKRSLKKISKIKAPSESYESDATFYETPQVKRQRTNTDHCGGEKFDFDFDLSPALNHSHPIEGRRLALDDFPMEDEPNETSFGNSFNSYPQIRDERMQLDVIDFVLEEKPRRRMLSDRVDGASGSDFDALLDDDKELPTFLCNPTF